MQKLLTIVFIVLSFSLKAQQDPMFTHYSFNTLSVNPAYAGSRNILSATALHRSQWVNFDGAPHTQTINLHSPILQNKAGAGLTFMNDKIGPTNTSSVFGDFAVKIKVNKKGKLALGLKAGLKFRSNKLTELELDQINDPKFQTNAQNQILPNLGFGFYYSSPKFYLGLGVPYLLRNEFSANANGSDNFARESRHTYIISGGVIELSKDKNIQLRPSTLLKIAEGAKPQLDITALFYFNNKIWLGPMFRTADAAGVLAGIKVSDQFSVGYSFDWSYGVNTGRYNGGGHELMLRYDFRFKNKGKIESPAPF